jgi:hypothetical protein
VAPETDTRCMLPHRVRNEEKFLTADLVDINVAVWTRDDRDGRKDTQPREAAMTALRHTCILAMCPASANKQTI